MGAEIDRSLKWAHEAEIASAFVTPRALSHLEYALVQAQKERRPLKIRLLLGLYQRFTPPEALAKLLNLQKAFPGRLYVRVARNKRFHWKLYIFQKASSRRIYVGSANLTDDGLNSSGELSIKLTGKAIDLVSNALTIEFDSIWQSRAFSLTRGIVKKYKKVKRPSIIPAVRDEAIARLLETAEKTAASPQSTTAGPKPRVVFADENLREETVEIVRSETEWERKNWDYMSNYKWWHDLTVKAKAFLFVTWYENPKEYWLEFRRVEDTAKIITPDGKHFIAHSRIPRGWRVRYNDIKSDLSKVGLTWKVIKRNKQLNKRQLQAVCRLLRVKRESLLQG